MKKIYYILSGLLLGIAIPTVKYYWEWYQDYRYNEVLAMIQIQTVLDSCAKYRREKGALPHNLLQLSELDKRGHAFLTNQIVNIDLFGRELRLTEINSQNFEIRSAGLDGKFYTWDDYYIIY